MKKKELTDIQKKQIIDKYELGDNLTSISSSLDIGRGIVAKFIKTHGYELKTKSEIIQDKIPALKDETYLRNLYKDKSLAEMAIHLNTNEQVVKTAFKKFNIKTSNRTSSFIKRKPQLGNKDYLLREYEVNKKSPKSIAKLIGCSSSAVENALRSFNIKIRSHNESSLLNRATTSQKINSKIARNLRTRLYIALSGRSKMTSAVRDLGISIEEFKVYLESKFYKNERNQSMAWDNYGEWEIDHILPLSSFNLSDKDQQKAACHYTNLQPLWKSENRSKSNIIGQKPNRVKMYLVIGPAGCGKSWVCDQLENINYISFDTIPKEQHYHYMVEMSKNGRPIVYDPFRKTTTIANRYNHLFDIDIVIISEPIDVVESRLISRGSRMNREIIVKFVNKFNNMKRFKFKGSSQEVLDFLQNDIAKQDRAT